MKQTYIFIGTFLIMIFTVFSLPAGEQNNLSVIEKCYGDIQLKLKGNISNEDISFKDCNYNENNIWLCKCKNPTLITFTTLPEVRNNIDVILQYNLYKPEGDEIEQQNALRIKKVSNLIIEEPKPEPFNFSISSEAAINGGIVLLIVLLLFILIVGFVMYKLFFTMDDDEKRELLQWKEELENK